VQRNVPTTCARVNCGARRALRAETIDAEHGTGAFVLQAGNLMQTDQFLAGVVIPAPFALAVGRLSSPLGARLLHWR